MKIFKIKSHSETDYPDSLKKDLIAFISETLISKKLSKEKLKIELKIKFDDILKKEEIIQLAEKKFDDFNISRLIKIATLFGAEIKVEPQATSKSNNPVVKFILHQMERVEKEGFVHVDLNQTKYREVSNRIVPSGLPPSARHLFFYKDPDPFSGQEEDNLEQLNSHRI